MLGTRLTYLAAAGIAAASLFASAASAATFSVIGGTATTLPTNFSASLMSGPTPLPAIGDPITYFSGATPFGAGEGLSLSGSSSLNYTYLGSEAAASNTFTSFSSGTTSISSADVQGTTLTTSSIGGIVAFLFSTIEMMFEDINGNSIFDETLSIFNGGTSDYFGLNIGFSAVFNGGRSILVFFGDGRGDADFDDMVIRIDAVPLPASILLMLGAFGGLGALRLRKKKAA